MPTMLPSRAALKRRLPWPKGARLLILVARPRLLDLRMHILVRQGFADDWLLRLMRRWLVLYEAIGALLPGMPEAKHVAEVRVILLISQV